MNKYSKNVVMMKPVVARLLITPSTKEYFNDSPQQQQSLPLIVINWKILHFFVCCAVSLFMQKSRAATSKRRQNYQEIARCSVLMAIVRHHLQTSETKAQIEAFKWNSINNVRLLNKILIY